MSVSDSTILFKSASVEGFDYCENIIDNVFYEG